MTDRLRIWPFPPRPKPDPAPAPAPAPEPTPEARPKYLRALWALKQIPFSRLFPLVFTVPFVVFLAISGLIAWVVVAASFITHLFRALT